MEVLLSPQPENYWALMKRSFLLYRSSFKHVILLSSILAIIAFIPRFLSLIIGQDIFLNLSPLDLNRLWLFVINIAGLVFFLSMLCRMHGVICSAHESLSEDIVLGIKTVLHVFIASIIQTTIVFAAALFIFATQQVVHDYRYLITNHLAVTLIIFFFMAQFFLLLYLYTLFVFLAPLIAIEKKSVISALKRSAFLVWNHWWRVFSVQITPWCCYLLFLSFIKFILHINVHIYFLEHNPHSLFSILFNILIFALFIPWVAALLIVQLKDLELRKNIIENTYA